MNLLKSLRLTVKAEVEARREAERRERERLVAFRQRYRRAVENLDKILSLERYPGSLNEFQEVTGKQYEIINLPGPDKRITVRDFGPESRSCLEHYRECRPDCLKSFYHDTLISDGDIYQEILDLGVSGFIHWEGWHWHYRENDFWCLLQGAALYTYSYGRGVPVREKRSD